MSERNYEDLGLKVGLEVHQQLETDEKLFCSCKPELFRGDPEITFLRRLRPTQSELGQIDEAALFEFRKGFTVRYEADHVTSCLVEMDEEPPHELNPEAVETSLMVALMIDAKPVDEIHVMRKIVIDGSNTTGFQRTCVISLGGEITVKGKGAPIQHIGLEEDAARKMGASGHQITYRIDRLGIPLIEVTTGPTINSPEEARDVALAIGRILRSTGRVKRGIGTIRQDLNISLRRGALIEIKGVQELEKVSRAVEFEVERQLKLIEIRDELKRRGVTQKDLRDEVVKVTHVFRHTKCRLISEGIERGGDVFALKLKGFGGILGKELSPNLRLGSEMADVARFWGGVGGLFQTDEMPKYGITEAEIEELKREVKCGGKDAAVFIADTEENAKEALRAVVRRAREALKGVPEETRVANPDGTSRYMRPRPGAARMYPETDVPPVRVTRDLLDKIRKMLPESFESKMERLKVRYGLNPKISRQIVDSDYLTLFEKIADKMDVSPTLIAVTLTETLKSLKREGLDVEALSDFLIEDLFRHISDGVMVKEAIPDVLRWFMMNPGGKVEEALKALGLRRISERELKTLVEKMVWENKQLIERGGMSAFGPLMGKLMAQVRGRAEAKNVGSTLKEAIRKFMERSDKG